MTWSDPIRGDDWPTDVERLNPGDPCELRFNAYPEWYRGEVKKNSMGGIWEVESKETRGHARYGEIVYLYIEHLRTVKGESK